MGTKDVVLSINVVEPALVHAVNRLSRELKIDLRGLMLVDKAYAATPHRPKDSTGLFEEVICNFNNPDELQTVLKPYLNRLLAVVVRYESAIQALRKAIPFLPYVNTPTETSLLWATDKSQMRARMANYDPRLVPKYCYVEQSDMPELNTMLRGFTYPLIVKPSGLAGALLVSSCDSEAAVRSVLERAFQVSREVYDRVAHETMPGFMVEEMMPGPMYSTDVYVLPDGEIHCLPLIRVVTGHEVGIPGFFGHELAVPIHLPDEEVAEAFRVSAAGIRALNLRAVTTHVELIRSPDGWKIIEIGARIGGLRHDAYHQAYGIDHVYNDLLIKLGKEPEMPNSSAASSPPLKHVRGFEIYADGEGIVASIDGVDEARKLPGVVFLNQEAKPGDKALFADKGGQAIVQGMLANADEARLEHDVARLRKLVTIRLRQVVS